MFYATIALAAAATVLAAQEGGQTASGNYSGLHKILRPTTVHDTQGARQEEGPRVYGRAIEVPRSTHGVRPGPCGMPIIAADASLDPKIIVPIPGSRNAEARIRTAEPVPCGPFATVPARTPEGARDGRR